MYLITSGKRERAKGRKLVGKLKEKKKIKGKKGEAKRKIEVIKSKSNFDGKYEEEVNYL